MWFGFCERACTAHSATNITHESPTREDIGTALAAIIAIAALLISGFGSIIARLAGVNAVFEGLRRIGLPFL